MVGNDWSLGYSMCSIHRQLDSASGECNVSHLYDVQYLLNGRLKALSEIFMVLIAPTRGRTWRWAR